MDSLGVFGRYFVQVIPVIADILTGEFMLFLHLSLAFMENTVPGKIK